MASIDWHRYSAFLPTICTSEIWKINNILLAKYHVQKFYLFMFHESKLLYFIWFTLKKYKQKSNQIFLKSTKNLSFHLRLYTFKTRHSLERRLTRGRGLHLAKGLAYDSPCKREIRVGDVLWPRRRVAPPWATRQRQKDNPSTEQHPSPPRPVEKFFSGQG